MFVSSFYKELAKRDLAVESHNVSCFCHSIQSIRTMSKLGSCHLGLKACLPCENDDSWGVVTAASFWRFLEGPLEGERQEGWEGSFPSVGKKWFYLNVLNSLFTTSDPTPRKDTQDPELIAFASQGLLGHVLKLMFPPEKKLYGRGPFLVHVACHAWTTRPLG